MSASASASTSNPSSSSSGDRLPAPLSLFKAPSAERMAEIEANHVPPFNAFLDSVRGCLKELVAGSGSEAEAAAICQKLNLDRVSVVVIFGNEACDADSQVCALVLAWYLSILYPFPQSGYLFVPMTNCPRSQSVLRADVLYLFRQAGVDVARVLYEDEVDVKALSGRQNVDLRVILVDHNNMRASQEWMADRVIGVLDHHRDDKLYPQTEATGNRIIQVVGSCTTLLADVIFRNVPYVLSADAFPPIDHSNPVPASPLGAIMMLHATLLLDTNNLSPVTQKNRPLDDAMYAKYMSAFRSLDYSDLKRRRADVSQLDTTQLLQKDTKYGQGDEYPHLIASIPDSLQAWSKRDVNLLPNIVRRVKEQNLRFAICLLAYTQSKKEGGKYHRQILVVVPKDGPDAPKQPEGTLDAAKLFDEIRRALEQKEANFDLVETPDLLPEEAHARGKDLAHVAVYEQRNLHATRKQVAPLMEQLLSKL